MFKREELKSKLAQLAKRNIFIGTSSWKYAGWCGQLYDEQRYIYRGKWSETRFQENCLQEYAEVFKTVCLDAAYYQFFEERYVAKLVAQVPEDFRFTCKVTDEITIKKFPQQKKHGRRAGKLNENYLNPDLFASAFVRPFENFKSNIGMFVFEFSKFYAEDYQQGRDFVADLDRFLEAIPKGWRYGVEVRNRNLLQPEYFAMLAKHRVAHIFNSWTAMPAVSEQMALPGSFTAPDFCGARFLLKPGRSFKEAKESFQPYKATQDAYADARAAAAQLIRRCLTDPKFCKAYLYVNNRLEGSALFTVLAVLEILENSEQR